MCSEAFGVVQRRPGIDEPGKLRDESAAGRRQSMLADVSCVAAVVQVESCQQHPLDLEGPWAVGMIFLQMPAAPQQVRHTTLVHGAAEAAAHHPPVALQDAVAIGAEHRGRVVEAAAGADGADGRFRRGEHPQPVAEGADPPAVSSGVTASLSRTCWAQEWTRCAVRSPSAFSTDGGTPQAAPRGAAFGRA